MADRSPRSRRRRWLRRLIAVAVLAGAAMVVGPWVYINFIKEDPPPRLSFDARDAELANASTTTSGALTPATSGAADVNDLSGTWTVAQPSAAGYRVKEVLFGQDTEGVGRTSNVEGNVTIEGTRITAAELSVDLTTVTSDEGRRDNQFRTRLMSTAEFPVALFSLEQPITIGAVPPVGEEVEVSATGTLSLRGVDKQVTIQLKARRTATGGIEVAGTYDLTFADFGIPDPSNQVASVGEKGLLEFLLTLTRAG